MSTVDSTSSHGELKRRLAEMVGTDASRYSTELGTERHKRLSAADIDGICEKLGLGFLTEETMQEQRDAIMIKLGRDHRTGARSWDSSDLLAVVEALEEGECVDDGRFGPVCCACTDPAVVQVDHPDHGARAVCEDHARDYPVISYNV